MNTEGAVQNIKSFFKKLLARREASVFLIIIFAITIVSILQPKFLLWNNMRAIMIGLSTDGLMAIGMAVVLVLGGIDLSVGSVSALACVITGGLFLGGMNIWAAALIAVIAGVGIGLFNGFMIAKVGLPPFIVTLGMMSLARGTAYIFTEGSPLSMGGLPSAFKFIGTGSIIGIPNVAKVKVWVYVLSAVLASIAGIMSLARFNVATPTLGTSAELRAITAAVIGGTSMTGGVGSIFGAVLGVILLNVLNSSLVMLNVSVYWQDFVNGAILIIAVTIDYLSHRKKAK